MKTCPKCNNLHDKNGIFCSRSCANSRVWTDEHNKKRSEKLKGKSFTRKPSYDLDTWKEKLRQTRFLKYKNTPFDNLGSENKRRRVFEEQNFCCARCGISEWLGQKISLELEHKDGINTNNDRGNLEGLCPNCHSITTTWRGRNKPSKNGEVSVSDELLLECLLATPNIRQGLLKAGLSAKGNNYQRAKNLLIKHNL